MNKQCFRVIFSKTLQQLVVVSELAKSEGKGGETSACSTSGLISSIFCKIRPLTFNLFCALGFVAFSENTLAETLIIQTDKTAAKNQQPIVLQTANGLPQVNIQTPNDKGLSHNKYNQFNVDTKGAILNNSRINTQTQQGGWVQGNPYLARGEAKVILNEVTSNNPSVLKGYVEVAGKKADVIIANPNGIHCAGCGVINSDRATLTTGKPQVNNGNLESLVVEKGKVKVSGNGLDNSRVDYTEILAREAEVNAGVWSKKEAKVVTGKNIIKRSNTTEELQIIHTKQPLAGETRPKFAVDVGELGGMYSGKIHLIGTENGVGVRNAGHIGASAETLKIDSQGRIVNTGTLNANQDIQLAGAKGLDNQGKIENRQGDITLNTPADIQQNGSVVARSGNIDKSANQGIMQQGETVAKGNIRYKAPKLTASTRSLIAAGVDIKDTAQGEERSLEATSAQGKTITVTTTEKATLHGKQLASGKLEVTAREADLSDSHTSANEAHIKATQDKIQVKHATLTANKLVIFSTPTTLQAQGSHIQSEKINTQQRSLNTQNATWEQTGNSELTLTVADTLQNQGGTFKTQGDLTIHASGMDNQQGRLLANGKLTLNTGKGKLDSMAGTMLAAQSITVTAGELLNNKGLIYSQQGNLTLHTHQADLNNRNGLIAAENGSLTLNTRSLHNTQGSITAKMATIDATQAVENRQTLANSTQGIIATDLTLNTKQLDNQAGRIIGRNNVTLQAKTLNNQAGELLAGKTAQVKAEKLDNQAGTLASVAANLSITTQSRLNNQQGNLSAADKLSVHTQGLNNQQGKITSSNQLVIDTAQQSINNQQGTIFATQQAEIRSGVFNNQQGLVRADETLVINTQQHELDNQYTQGGPQGIVGLGKVTLQGVTALLNQQGKLYAETALNATVQQTTDNRQGAIQSSGTLNLSTAQLDNQAGTLSGKVSHINAQAVNNRAISADGSLIYGESLTLKTQQLDNQGTKATGATPSQGIQGNHIKLNSENLNNQQGGIYSSNNATLAVNYRLDNQQGEILALHSLQTQHQGNLMVNNQGGLMQGNQAVELNAKGLEAQGKIKTAGYLAVNLKDSFTLNHAFEAGDNLTFKTEGNFTNNAVQRVANKLSVTASQIANHANAELSGNESQLNAQQLTNRGLIDGTKTYIDSHKVTNIGTGRIYGNHLAIKADTVENLAETLNGETKAGTIAARSRLDFGVNKLINRDHALLLSLGEAYVGRTLDENYQAMGKANLIENESATIEFLGKSRVEAKKVVNKDTHVKIKYRQETEYFDLYGLEEPSTKKVETWYRMGVEGTIDHANGQRRKSATITFFDHSRPKIEAHKGQFWLRKAYTQTREIPESYDMSPAKFLVGSDFTLNSESVLNEASQLMIGNKFIFNSQNVENADTMIKTATGVLENKDLTAIQTYHDEGSAYRYRQDRRRAGKSRHHKNFFDELVRQELNTTTPSEVKFNQVLHTIGSPVTSNVTLSDQAQVKDIQLDTVSVIANEAGKLSANITLVPTINNNDVVGSGQVIAKLQTTIDNFDSAALANMTMPMVKTQLAEVSLPQASIYKINPNHPQGYLVETDPRFTDRQQWLSSDYMFDQLRYNHDNILKRLGDGFYEQRLVNEQVNQLTGRRYIEGYNNDIEQYRALMNNGVKYAKQFNLSVGVGLTAKQMSELTTDMVWLVNKEVTLADGRKVKALVPQVYLVARNSDITSFGAVISANEIVGKVDNLQNSGVIAGRDITRIHSNQLENRGTILGEIVDLSAKQTLVNLAGKIEAVKALSLSAGERLEIASTLSSSESQDGNFARTVLDQVGSVKVTGENGSLALHSDGNLTLKAANIESNGILRATAGDTLQITTLNTRNKEHYNGDANNYYRLDQAAEVGTVLSAKQGVSLIAQNNATLRQADVSSENGKVLIGSVRGDVNVEVGRAEEQLSSSSKSTHRGRLGLSKTTTISRYAHNIAEAVASNIDGQDVALIAQQGNVTVKGSNVVAEQDLDIYAKNNVSIVSDVNTHYQESETTKRKSGLMGSGGIGFTIGSKKEQVEQDRTQESAAGSQVGSLKGNVTIQAGENYQQTGSVVTSGKGDVDILAESANITAARSDYDSNYKYTMEQKGITIALTGAVASAIQAVDSTAKSAKALGNSKNSRVNAMGAVNAGFEAMRTVGQLQDIAQAASAGSATGGAVGVSITYGEQKSTQTQHSEGNTAEKSQVNAGGKVNIRATGKGEQSHITIAGSDVSGQAGTHLKADGKVNIEAVDENHLERSKNKSSGFNVGVAIQFGNGIAAGITAGGNVAKGYGNGDSQAWVASQVGDKNSRTTIESGGDTNIIGSQVQGKRVEVAAENLNIESLQDTAKYKGKQESASAQVTVGYGASVGGSYNKSKVNSNYASVNTQAGIFAGDEGYDVNVKNHTELTAGLVTSTDKAEAEGKNRFSTGTLNATNLDNHADYKGSSIGVSGSVAMNFDTPLGNKDNGIAQSNKQATNEKGEKIYIDQNGEETTEAKTGGNANRAKLATGWNSLQTSLGVGLGSTKENNQSVTRSGINTANIEIRDSQAQLETTGKSVEETLAQVKTDVTTATAEAHSGKLANNFDKEKVLKELNIQVKATQEFRQNAFSTIDAYVLPKQAELREKIKQAKTEEEKTALYKEVYKLQYQKRLLETTVGIATGTPELAITQGTLQLAATKMREETLENSRVFGGITDKKTGQKISNVSYDSGYFDGVKLGGVRIDLDVICNSGMGSCSTNNDGSIVFDGYKNFTLNDAIDPKQNEKAKDLYGPTGGFQPKEGGWYAGGAPVIPYKKGSFSDLLVESFAGTHDMLGGQIWGWYDKQGNTSQKNSNQQFLADRTTEVAIPVAAPFALSDLMSSDVMEVLFKLGGN